MQFITTYICVIILQYEKHYQLGKRENMQESQNWWATPKKGIQLVTTMQKKNTVIVNKLAGKRADLVGFCRYLKNDKVSMDTLKKEEISKTENNLENNL